MKTIDEFLKETVEPMDFTKVLSKGAKFKINLNEAPEDDFAGDDEPPADDGPDDFGGDDFGGGPADFGGDDMGGDSGEESEEGADGEEGDKPEEDVHEDDPDFTNMIKDTDSPVQGTPAAETIYDSEGVLKSIKGVIEALPQEELVEIEGVKKCLELIFSGKKLKPEDLDFDNIQNAIFLFNKILEPVDDKTKNYAKIKLKTPIQLSRDKDKLELASRTKELERKRDTILGIDKL